MSRTERAKQRFLAAYAEQRQIAGACRLAEVHRSTVYRWTDDPAFVEAMQAAWDQGHKRWLREVYEPEQRARKAEHDRRCARSAPIWRANLEKARQTRAEKRRRRGW